MERRQVGGRSRGGGGVGGEWEDRNKGALYGQGRWWLIHRLSRIEGQDSGGFTVPPALTFGVGMAVGVEKKEKEEGG